MANFLIFHKRIWRRSATWRYLLISTGILGLSSIALYLFNPEKTSSSLAVQTNPQINPQANSVVDDNFFEGIWTGSVVQENRKFTAEVTISGDQYTADYPSLGCRGELELLSKNTYRMEFITKLSYGKKRCINNGKVILSKTDIDHLQYHWQHPTRNISARGKLSRQ